MENGGERGLLLHINITADGFCDVFISDGVKSDHSTPVEGPPMRRFLTQTCDTLSSSRRAESDLAPDSSFRRIRGMSIGPTMPVF